jgi:hypothetical protein
MFQNNKIHGIERNVNQFQCIRGFIPFETRKEHFWSHIIRERNCEVKVMKQSLKN